MRYKVLLGLGLVLIIAASINGSSSGFIAVDLVGYDIDQKKEAFLVNTDANKFELIEAQTNEVVYQGFLGKKTNPDKATGDAVSIIDFSEFQNMGSYYIRIAGDPEIRSEVFRIGDNVYREVTNTVIESYYYHRCGTEVGNGKQWSYEACHLDDAPFYDNKEMRKDVTGGWHDAGDYNKFSVNTALSAGLLLSLYELKPSYFTDGQLAIPESDNGTPDLLDEVSWALKWFLKMQRSDGAVYHKVSQKKWTGEYMPDEDPETRYIFEISSSATATFAAVVSMGARLMEKYDHKFAEELSEAALKAWHYLEENPEQQPKGGFQNPDDVHGGEYRDPDDSDERLWASIELYKLTRDKELLHYFVTAYQEMNPYNIPALSWKNFESMALSSFLSADPPDQYSGIKKKIKSMFVRHADYLLNKRENNNYRNLLNHKEYYWGSNSVGLAYAFDLIQAYNFTNKKEYEMAALDQLHFILGRNPINRSQVTAVGSRSVQKPYHQFSEMGNFDQPVPGMLVGGPNNHLLLNDKKLSSYPGKSYEDRFKNYLVNEPAINFTALLAYVSGYFSIK